MSTEAAFTREWAVGRYTATLTMPKAREPGAVRSACVEWQPSMPLRLTPDEMRVYRAGRDAALADLARELGINMAVVDL